MYSSEVSQMIEITLTTNYWSRKHRLWVKKLLDKQLEIKKLESTLVTFNREMTAVKNEASYNEKFKLESRTKILELEAVVLEMNTSANEK